MRAEKSDAVRRGVYFGDTTRRHQPQQTRVGNAAEPEVTDSTPADKLPGLEREGQRRHRGLKEFSAISGYYVHMPDYRAMETKIQQMLGTTRRPVAVAFLEAPPAGVTRFTGSEPSSCSFWRLAAEGRAFYTVPSDHFNCPVGSYAHNTVTAERMPELEQALTLMSDIGYIRMEEIPGVFQLPVKPEVVMYAPLGDTPVAPSVVLVAAKPGRIMMLAEAATRAGAMSSLPLLGRPTCMAVPAALAQGTVTSAGCIGNRVYTGIGEDELYVVLRGADLEAIAAEIDTIHAANQTLTGYHQERRQNLTRL